jgi:hypothetical protein
MYRFAGTGARYEEARSRRPCAAFLKSIYTYPCGRSTHNQAIYRPQEASSNTESCVDEDASQCHCGGSQGQIVYLTH